jgi:hypothetical protein
MSSSVPFFQYFMLLVVQVGASSCSIMHIVSAANGSLQCSWMPFVFDFTKNGTFEVNCEL